MTPSGLFVGLVTLDVVQRVDRLPERNQKITETHTRLASGVPATVAAIAFATQGGRARLWTALGSGAAADAIRADLASVGVEVIDAAPFGFEVATSSVLLARHGRACGGERVGHRPGHDPSRLELRETDVVLVDDHHQTR